MNLKEKIERLKAEVKQLNECLRRKNIALDAMHWVWCSGGCNGGVNRYIPEELTEEMVLAAEKNTCRLRKWYENHEFKNKWAKMTPEEKAAWFKDNQPIGRCGVIGKDEYRKIESVYSAKECPFCGHPGELWEHQIKDGGIRKVVMCSNNGEGAGSVEGECPMYMPPEGFYCATKSQALKTWNTRAQAPLTSEDDTILLLLKS